MATTNYVVDESNDTTDESADDHRALDLDAARAVSIDGATLVECDVYTRTDGALRFDGSEPLFIVGIYSERDARAQLAAAGYESAAIERAFRLGGWMEDGRPERATDAIRAAEHDEARMMADGSQAGCEICGADRTFTVPDDHHLATDFDRLCPDCGGMSVCTKPGCDEAFWNSSARARHIQDEHEHESNQEGAARCSNCDGEASPERRSVPDPRVDRNRQQLVCPRCGDYLGGGRLQ